MEKKTVPCFLYQQNKIIESEGFSLPFSFSLSSCNLKNINLKLKNKY
jgi:hypothetical protein